MEREHEYVRCPCRWDMRPCGCDGDQMLVMPLSRRVVVSHVEGEMTVRGGYHTEPIELGDASVIVEDAIILAQVAGVSVSLERCSLADCPVDVLDSIAIRDCRGEVLVDARKGAVTVVDSDLFLDGDCGRLHALRCRIENVTTGGMVGHRAPVFRGPPELLICYSHVVNATLTGFTLAPGWSQGSTFQRVQLVRCHLLDGAEIPPGVEVYDAV